MYLAQFAQSIRDDLEAIQLPSLLLNLAISILLGHILSWHYQRFAHVLSNKRKFARIFVFVAATTFLMITVVKRSLALSLGLVGALSIIRFRTPIKEPEELAYLFLAIAIGVGLGADLALPTVVVFTVILLYLALRGPGAAPPVRTVLQVSAPLPDAAADPSGSAALRSLMPAVEEPCTKVDLRRVDCSDGELHASLLVELKSAANVALLLSAVQTALPGATVSVIDHSGLE